MWRTLLRWWWMWQGAPAVRPVPAQVPFRPVARRAGRVVLGMLLVISVAAPLSAENQPEEKTVRKQVNGEVTYVTKHAINVEYERKGTSSFEMVLPISPKTKFVHLKRVTDLSPGDYVTVTYDKVYRESQDGGEPVLIDTQATEVQLVRRGVQDALRSQEADDAGGEE